MDVDMDESEEEAPEQHADDLAIDSFAFLDERDDTEPLAGSEEANAFVDWYARDAVWYAFPDEAWRFGFAEED